MNSQMTIWDFIEKPERRFPMIIEELSAELHQIFDSDKCNLRNETYYLWQHVPNLGKRYSLFVDITSDYAKTLSLEALIEKYKQKQLEISVCVTPALIGDKDHSLMISTMWLTRGHKEIDG